MRRAELTDLTGLNRSTVAGLVAELAALGAVTEETGSAGPEPAAPSAGSAGKPHGKGRPGSEPDTRAGARPASKAGRPSPVVRPCPETVQVLAADVAVGRISVALVGLGGTVVARRDRQVDHGSPATVARLLAETAAALLAGPEAGRHVVGLGASVPGVVRRVDGNVRFAPNLGWEDQPLGDLLLAELEAAGVGGLPVQVGNDGDLGALAEHRRGVARAADDLVFVEGEVGVGCGVIIGGRPLSGVGGYAGELGHMTVRPDGRRCRCGARGCWETEIGTEAIARALGLTPTGNQADNDAVIALLRAAADPGAGPAMAVQMALDLGEVAEYLGLGLANVINLLNPELVVLGGVLRELYPIVAGQVGRALAGTALRAPMESVTLAVPELGGDAVLIGAAEFAWEATLADPVAVLG
jgi:predicted NBD/HSP70 family sugar kinase